MSGIETKVRLYGDPVFCLMYYKKKIRSPKKSPERKKSSKRSKESKRGTWVGLDIMQFRPDPRDDLWPSIEYDALIERDNRGVKYVTVKNIKYKIVR